MKLAEALAERSDCQNRIAEVNKRLARSARVQEGEQPPEDPVALLAELDRLYARLLELVQAINRTNARTQLDGRVNISDAIAERDLAGKKRDHLAALAEAASTRQDRYSKSEVKFVSTLPIADLQKAGRSIVEALPRTRHADSGTELEDGSCITASRA